MGINWQDILNQITQFGATWGIRVVGVLVALFAGWIFAGWVKKAIIRALADRLDKSIVKFLANLTRYAIIAVVIIGCLGVFGFQTASFAAVLAAAGLAIGLAFQGTLSNFAAGVMLLIFRPFKVEDLVQVGDKVGVVQEIDLFSTEIKTAQGLRVIIPNSSIFGNVIVNYTFYPARRADIPVGVAYDADLDRTREVLEAVAATIPGALADPPPQVFLDSLGDSSVNWQLRAWCKPEEYWDVYQATVRAAKQALDQAGISIPFPQQDLHLDPVVVEAIGRDRPALPPVEVPTEIPVA